MDFPKGSAALTPSFKHLEQIHMASCLRHKLLTLALQALPPGASGLTSSAVFWRLSGVNSMQNQTTGHFPDTDILLYLPTSKPNA